MHAAAAILYLLIRERCNVVSPQEGVGSAREIWGVEAREGEHLVVTCRFLGDVEVDGSALLQRCGSQTRDSNRQQHIQACAPDT